MTGTPPPFKGFSFAGDVFVSDEELQAKVRSLEIEPFVYSTVADGHLDPVAISAAAFSVAVERGWENFSDPRAARQAFQIMIRDGDERRAPALRRRIRVPHWIYVIKAEPATEGGEHSPQQQMHFPGDLALIEEGVKMAEAGKKFRPIARELAPRAAGNSVEAKEDRLRRAISETYKLRHPSLRK